MIRYLFLLSLFATPAHAQTSAFCQELWLSRNTVLDRAGHCFGSPLGQAVFDNSDCVEGDVRLNPLDTELVRVADAIERWADCAVDTSAEQLMNEVLPFHARLMELVTVPVRIDSEHGCWAYNGPSIPLFAGISTSTTTLGSVEPGHWFSLSHNQLRGGWEYLEVSDGEGTTVAHGWTRDLPQNFGDFCAVSPG